MALWVCVCVCVCMCCFRHRNVTHVNYKLISNSLKNNTFLIQQPHSNLWGMKSEPISRNTFISVSTAVFSHQYIAVKLAANTRQTAAVRCTLLLIWCISGGVRPVTVWGIPLGRMVSIKFNSRRIQCNLFLKNTAVFIIWQLFHQSIISEWNTATH